MKIVSRDQSILGKKMGIVTPMTLLSECKELIHVWTPLDDSNTIMIQPRQGPVLEIEI